MHYFAYALLCLYMVNIVASIALIDVDRKPITRGSAIVGTIFNGLLMLGVYHFFIR